MHKIRLKGGSFKPGVFVYLVLSYFWANFKDYPKPEQNKTDYS